MSLTEADRFIPFHEICRVVRCTPNTLQRACLRHDIPIAQLSPRSKRMLSATDYAELLKRFKNSGRATNE